MQNESKSLVWGIILIIIGFLFLGNNLDWFYFDWATLWPALMILGGVIFWVIWVLGRRDAGLLMPGTILISYGILFLYCTIQGWGWMDELWPVFLLGPGLGFLFMFVFGNHDTGLLVPGFILIFLTFLFWSDYSVFRYLWPLLLIGIGVLLLLKARGGSLFKKKSESDVT